VTFCLTKDKQKEHKKTKAPFLRAKIAFALTGIHANDLCASSADEGKVEQLIFNLQVARNTTRISAKIAAQYNFESQQRTRLFLLRF